MDPDRPPTAVLTVRVWKEDSAGSLRARITRSLDIESSAPEQSVAASPEDVLRVVATWLEAFAER